MINVSLSNEGNEAETRYYYVSITTVGLRVC